MAWNPAKYLRFGSQRLRPALDLLAQVQPGLPVKNVVDLGCGPGNVTPLLRAAFPEAHIACVDNSPEMLASARESLAADGNVSFWQASMETYAPSAPVQVVFCNAALHWARDQLGVMARMVDWLTPGGVLAIQMPHTQQQPSHLLMDALLREQGHGARVDAGELRVARSDHDPKEYHRLLVSRCPDVQVWTTSYYQVLEGEEAVFHFMASSGLRGLQELLGGPEHPDAQRLAREFRERVAQLYPPEPDGRTLFPFSRVFVVATRRA